jgi:hypothetical protein
MRGGRRRIIFARRAHRRERKAPISLRIDREVLLKAGGRQCPSRINAVLKAYVEGEMSFRLVLTGDCATFFGPSHD